MAVYESSRYKGSYIFIDDDKEKAIPYLSPFRDNVFNPEMDDLVIVFEAGMRIDILARRYYGLETMDWVIMDANPKYSSPFDIKVGDHIVIPSPERVMTSE